MITVASVLGGVVKALRGAFPECAVYTENVRQGLAAPCFSVICEEPVIQRVLGKRFFRRFDFCVYFYPGRDDFFAEINDAFEKMLPALELIEVDGDLIRGSDFSSKTVDGVLVICASYGTFVYDGEKAPAMGALDFRQRM